TRRAVQGAQRVRAARAGPDEARIAAASRASLGIPLLRGYRGGRRTCLLRAGARASGRVRPDASHAGLVCVVEDARAPAARFLRGGVMTFVPNPLTDGPSRAPARAMLKAVGFTDDDLKKPLIGVANTWIEIGPCNYHLRDLAAHVKAGIREAG